MQAKQLGGTSALSGRGSAHGGPDLTDPFGRSRIDSKLS